MRKKLLWGLVIASAISMMMQYVLQGALATGHAADFFSGAFWTLDAILWGLRAIIEAAVVAYLFQTKTDIKGQQRALAWLEFALIALIAITLGPALRAIGTGRSMAASLKEPFFTIWNFGIAAYAPLMIGSAGFAYKCQPVDDDDLAQADKQVDNLIEQGKEKDKQIAQLQEQLQLAQSGKGRRKLDPAQLRELALANPTVDGKWLADRLGVDPGTISRNLDAAGIRKNGNGWTVTQPAHEAAQ